MWFRICVWFRKIYVPRLDHDAGMGCRLDVANLCVVPNNLILKLEENKLFVLYITSTMVYAQRLNSNAVHCKVLF